MLFNQVQLMQKEDYLCNVKGCIASWWHHDAGLHSSITGQQGSLIDSTIYKLSDVLQDQGSCNSNVFLHGPRYCRASIAQIYCGTEYNHRPLHHNRKVMNNLGLIGINTGPEVNNITMTISKLVLIPWTDRPQGRCE